MSTVRQTAGNAVAYIRSVASRITADDGIAGLHCVRSKRRYRRRFAALPDATSFVVEVPKLLVAEACRTDASITAVVVAGVPVSTQLRYGVSAWDVKFKPAANAPCSTTAAIATRMSAIRARELIARSPRGRPAQRP